jgi:hypothetical protein
MGAVGLPFTAGYRALGLATWRLDDPDGLQRGCRGRRSVTAVPNARARCRTKGNCKLLTYLTPWSSMGCRGISYLRLPIRRSLVRAPVRRSLNGQGGYLPNVSSLIPCGTGGACPHQSRTRRSASHAETPMDPARLATLSSRARPFSHWNELVGLRSPFAGFVPPQGTGQGR